MQQKGAKFESQMSKFSPSHKPLRGPLLVLNVPIFCGVGASTSWSCGEDGRGQVPGREQPSWNSSEVP